MSDSRVHPPSERVLRAARAAGLFPRTEVIGLGASLSALVICGGTWGRAEFLELSRACRALFATAGRADALHALTACKQLVGPALVAALVPLLAAALLVAALRIALVGVSFGSGTRLRIARPSPRTLTARVLALLGAAGVVLHACATLLPRGADAFSAPLQRELVYLAAWCCLCALVEASFARAAFVRTLHLSAREQREDEREVFGDPALRAARQRAHKSAVT